MRNEPLPFGELRDSVILQAASAAARARLQSDREEFDVCLQGREAGWSWQRLSAALLVNSETLRRRHSALVTARLADRALLDDRR
jgi:hypothetical protein